MIKDARIYQIIFLSIFLFLGVINRDWSLNFIDIGLLFFTCFVTQIFLSSFRTIFWVKSQELININNNQNLIAKIKNKLDFSSGLSAIISALGLSLLFRSNDSLMIVLAGFLAIASKFLFSYNGKHFFNPANFGIIIILMINKGWVSVGQWGEDWLYLFLFLATGLTVLNKVGRWETSLVFLATYFSLFGIYDYWLGWDFDVWQHQLMNGGLLVFAFFMLSDPRSIPNAKISRIIWAFLIAILAFIWRSQFYIENAIFWSLFILSPTTILFDYFFPNKNFEWPIDSTNLDS